MSEESSTPLTVDEIAVIKARCEAATRGPWVERDNNDEGKGASTIDRRCPMACGSVCSKCRGDDIACLGTDGRYVDNTFIAAARTDVPRLLADNARLRAALTEALAIIDAAVGRIDGDDGYRYAVALTTDRLCALLSSRADAKGGT